MGEEEGDISKRNSKFKKPARVENVTSNQLGCSGTAEDLDFKPNSPVMLSGHGPVNGSDLCNFLDEVGRAKPFSKSHVLSPSHEYTPSIVKIAKQAEGLALICRYGTDEKKSSTPIAGERENQGISSASNREMPAQGNPGSLDGQRALNLLAQVFGSPTAPVSSTANSPRRSSGRESFATSSYRSGKQKDRRWMV